MSKVQAIILAGGRGTRLRPYTTILPKPLMPLGEFPIAEIIIRQLKRFGIKNIVISTGHMAELIEAFFGDGERWGVHISYIREDAPLGTAGAIKLVKNVEDDFLVINGDVLTDIHFDELFKFHKKRKNIATITLKERKVMTDFGVVETNGRGELMDYIEKPQHKSFVSMGIYILNKNSKEYIRQGESMGMPELMLRMKRASQVISCLKTKALWLDLGRLDDFQTAQDIFAKYKKRFLLNGLEKK